METCPSCGESLNLVEDVGLRPADETEAVPGVRSPSDPGSMVCSVCSWPVDETHPDRRSARSGAARITTVNSPRTGPEANARAGPPRCPARTYRELFVHLRTATAGSVSPTPDHGLEAGRGCMRRLVADDESSRAPERLQHGNANHFTSREPSKTNDPHAAADSTGDDAVGGHGTTRTPASRRARGRKNQTKNAQREHVVTGPPI